MSKLKQCKFTVIEIRKTMNSSSFSRVSKSIFLPLINTRNALKQLENMYPVTSRTYISRKMIDWTGSTCIISSYNHNDRRQ